MDYIYYNIYDTSTIGIYFIVGTKFILHSNSLAFDIYEYYICIVVGTYW